MLSDPPHRFRLRRLLVPVLSLGTVAYFIFNLFIGDYSLSALQRMREEGTTLRAELEVKRAQRQGMELRVTLMRPESIDPDMLDERAREVLNLSHPNDITIIRAQR